MAKITRIKANEASAKEADEPAITRKKVIIEDKKQKKNKRKEEKKRERAEAKKREDKKVFVLFRPFVKLGRYLGDSWREIRQVHWPDRKATFKMLVAVLIYTVLFVVLIASLDAFFAWFFKLIIK
ncbi:MAG: preprotein translocase subunit SecE [Candidatus Saccharibacteria bacterium]|nr:preprotein translocase subunit SecE [Candidatus Saccharibacteria bacterium]